MVNWIDPFFSSLTSQRLLPTSLTRHMTCSFATVFVRPLGFLKASICAHNRWFMDFTKTAPNIAGLLSSLVHDRCVLLFRGWQLRCRGARHNISQSLRAHLEVVKVSLEHLVSHARVAVSGNQVVNLLLQIGDPGAKFSERF